MNEKRKNISRALRYSLPFLFAASTALYSKPFGPEQLLPSDTTAKGSYPREKTCFQISAPWKAEYDVRSDVAIVYGMSDDFNERAAKWKEKGYTIHFMTGIAWGEYQDYFLGKYDGKTHWEEGQTERNGNMIMHGVNVPYVVPTENYISYFKTLVKKAIDAGVTAIHLEEPEFWARSGYSPAFKDEWQKYYGFPWMAQHESPEATYLSSKLKYHMYFNALKEVFQYAKEYSESKGKRIRCYVPTHSLINYSQWQIVSPEASLAALPGMDGYIAQVWTGTSREPNFFNGLKKERVFENAFLEYGSMVSMTAPTGRKMFLLTDPIEDWPRSWDDYKKNYQATFTAEIMYPMVADFEVMPWPNRIYLGKFKVAGMDEPQPIAKSYATQMQVMVNSLNDMPLSENRVNGSKGIGVLLCNSMMFQRFPTHNSYEDPQLSNFYGMILPLVKKGVPVETVHMENLQFENTLKNIKVLVMSYSNMKPLSPDYHKSLAEWVKKGGVLIYLGRDNDPFQSVKEWWNSNGNSYKSPSVHLFEQMNITPAEGKTDYTFGKGKVYIVREDPKEIVMQSSGDKDFLNLVKNAYEKDAKAGKFVEKNFFYLERGPFDIASVLDESVSEEPLHLKGPVIDLFDPELPVLNEKIVKPGEQAYLYDLNRLSKKSDPKVLCTAARVYDEKYKNKTYSFVAKSPSKTWNSMRILLPEKPTDIKVKNSSGQAVTDIKSAWDNATKTLLLQFENESDGISVALKCGK
ncbi:MAG: hypothetical protein Q8933_20500 [Bacteroidota bacterium]|nr:hypothetical protein [Bacteroidota bacterium]